MRDLFQSQHFNNFYRLVLGDDKDMHHTKVKERCNLAPIPLAFEHSWTWRLFSNWFSTFALFKIVFNHVARKTHIIIYWEDQNHTTTLDKSKSEQELS